MLFYAAALQTLNYDWDTLENGALALLRPQSPRPELAPEIFTEV